MSGETVLQKRGFTTESAIPFCRVSCFSDTFGLDSNNGVGRFLHDLSHYSREAGHPLLCIAPGKGDSQSDLMRVKAPSFSLPGYEDVTLSMPLEHQRRTITRKIRDCQTEVVHVSTPGPFGCLGLSIARDLRLPTVGIYHTDFPRYAHEVAKSQLARYQDDPTPILNGVANSPVAGVVQQVADVLGMLQHEHPQVGRDFETLTEIVSRNLSLAKEQFDFAESGGELARKLATNVLRRFYARFSLVVARGPGQTQELIDTLGVTSKKVRRLVPGTDTERFHPNYRNRRLWREWGVPEGAFVLLHVGRASAEKNFEFTLRVWEALLPRLSQISTDRPADSIRLVVVGKGDERLLDRARQLPQTHILGSQNGEKLSQIYASADLLVFPSVTETLGQVGLEAGASGLPVVVSDQGGPAHYVRDGTTGFVLSTTEPEAWCQTILEIIRNDAFRTQLGENARNHVANEHTIEASLRSYFTIHQEALTISKQRKRKRKRQRSRILLSQEIAPDAALPGLMIISDYHAGKRFNTTKEKKGKIEAIEHMLRLAMDMNLRVVFAGDFGDHGARPNRLEEDFAALRDARRRVGFNQSPVFVRGNHDFGFTDQEIVDFTGGCRVQTSLVYYDELAQVTVVHGHILGLTKIAELVVSSVDRKELIEVLREDALDDELKPSVIAYDLANLIESQTSQLGLSGLGPFWEGLSRTRAGLAETLFGWGQRATRGDARTWKLIASLVGAHNDGENAALLGHACGGWATIFGHTHEPMLRKYEIVLDQATKQFSAIRVKSTNNHGSEGSAFPIGQEKVVGDGEAAKAIQTLQLVGNSGNMNRRRPSCIVAHYPSLCLYRFRTDDGKLRLTRRVDLEETERNASNDRTLPEEVSRPSMRSGG